VSCARGQEGKAAREVVAMFDEVCVSPQPGRPNGCYEPWKERIADNRNSTPRSFTESSHRVKGTQPRTTRKRKTSKLPSSGSWMP
jgi:thiamine monophosphate kinase